MRVPYNSNIMNYALQITLVLGMITQSAGQCFQLAQCTCHEPTKITCKLANLTVVPNNIVPNVNILWLDLSYNNITILTNDSFVWAKMNTAESIHHLNLQDNTINTIEMGTFDPLSNLTYLNLATNNITHFPTEILRSQPHLSVLMLSKNEHLQLSPLGYNLPALTKLSLRHCKLKNISNLFFQNMRNISHLNIGNNLLTHLHEDLFASLPNLEYLSLSNNRLTSVAYLMSVSSSAYVELWGNPWRCDCKLAIEFHELSLTRDEYPLLCGFTTDGTFQINSSSYLTICKKHHSSSSTPRVHDSSIVVWSSVVCVIVIACVVIVVKPVRVFMSKRVMRVCQFMRDLECVSSDDEDEGLVRSDPHTTEMSTF